MVRNGCLTAQRAFITSNAGLENCSRKLFVIIYCYFAHLLNLWFISNGESNTVNELPPPHPYEE